MSAEAAAAAPKPAHPQKGTSLWVGDLAPEVSETTLFSIFNAVAPVATIRVCRNVQTRESLGYAYVNFSNATDAEHAMSALNYANINGKPCRIMWSQRDPTIRRSNVGNVFVKNVGPDMDAKQLHDTFKLFGNILSCKVAQDGKGVSKGYGFVHFETEAAATEAIKAINGLNFNGRVVQVMPFLPKPLRSGPEWTNIYVKNLPKGFTQKDLVDMFGQFGEIYSSVIIQDGEGNSKGFGFVCYKTHTGALAAVEALNGKEMDGEPASQPPARVRKAKDGEKSDEEGKPEGPRKLTLYVGRAQKKSERERSLREAQEASKRERRAKWVGCNLYVRNLDESIDDAKLRAEFAPHGTIVSARVEKDVEGRSRLFGYVCLSTPEEANKAIQALHQKMVAGKPLYVQLWQSKEARQAAIQSQTAERAARNGAGAPNAGMAAGAVNPTLAANQQQMMLMVYQFFLQQLMNGGNPAMQSQIAAMQRLAQAQRPMVGQAPMNGMPRPGVMPAVPNMATIQAMMQQQMLAQMQQANAANGARPAPNAGAGPRRQTLPGGAGAVPAGTPRNGAPGARPANAPGAQAPRPAGPRGTASPAGKPQTQQAGNMQYRNAARNVETPGMMMDPAQAALAAASVMAAAGPVAQAVPAVPVAAGTDNFAAELAQAEPSQRKNMIGERLYTPIVREQPEKAGKITGMLLEGMDESELLHLLEAPEELRERIKEALEVLRNHEESDAK